MARELKKNCFLVNAPAGSGKTTQIKRMLMDITREKPKDNILCITYTNRAADELTIGIKNSKIYIGTIHSFLSSLMRRYFSHLKILDLFFELYGEKIQERILNQDANEHVAESNARYIEKFGELNIDVVKKNITSIYYNESTFNSLYYGGISHDDLITFSKATMDAYPIIKKRISSKYQYAFIDEYQDTSSDVLNILFDSFADTNSQLYLFGDKMQQIYNNYDGAFEDKLSLFDTSKSLKINYRSTSAIVDLLNNIYNTPEMKQQSSRQNEQIAGQTNKPNLLICDNIQNQITRLEDENSLILYLLNAKRFEAIGARGLFDAYSHMDMYSYGMVYSPVDILVTEYSENPDPLIKLMYLAMSIWHDYKTKKHGLFIQKLKKYKSVFNDSISHITSHKDKLTLSVKIKHVIDIIDDENKCIGDLLSVLGMDLVRQEYINNILEDGSYEAVIAININEVKSITNYLSNPRVSTQHGVKGESHDSVIFVAEDSPRLYVHIYKFFEMWPHVDISLPKFQNFYYSYSSLLSALEMDIGLKVSDLRADSYKGCASTLVNKAEEFVSKFCEEPFFGFLCKSAYEKFLSSPNISNAKNCFKVSTVYGPLSAYKLFYVGCSRARRKLSILLDRAKMKGDLTAQSEKFRQLGFEVSFHGNA